MAEIFDIENMPKLLKGPNQHLFEIFFINSICNNSARISPISLIYEPLWISFLGSFSWGRIYIVKKH